MFSTRTIGLAALAVAAYTKVASAQGAFTIQINNYCDEDIYIYQSTDGGCDYGWTSFGTCSTDPGACFGDSTECFGLPWILVSEQTYYMPFIQDSLGTSMKIATDPSFDSILQFEYTVSDNIYWDISLLNGGVDGTVGTPFQDENISMGPITTGTGTCAFVGCIAGFPCQDAYTNPYDDDTRACPLSNNQFFIDLCPGI